MVRYYDIILALIPLSLLGIAAVLTVAGLPTVTAIPGGALVATALIGHALFVNSPQDDVDAHRTAAGSSTQPPTINAD